jgi:hypothetical protein
LKKDKVTLAITSCGRMDLLEKTLISFFKFNTYPIDKTIIIEDSGSQFDQKRIAKIIPSRYAFIINKKNIGQIKSIDKIYKKITTPYIFHCEDDWEFYQPGFIEESLKVLKSNPKIFTLWLRAHNDTNGHPLSSTVKLKGSNKYKLLQKNYRTIWHGFTFNPGLRRLSDYLKFAPYAKQKLLLPEKNKSIISEADLSIKYEKLGFRSAISNLPDGYVRHIGYAHHVPQEWERGIFKIMIVSLKNFAKKILSKLR